MLTENTNNGKGDAVKEEFLAIKLKQGSITEQGMFVQGSADEYGLLSLELDIKNCFSKTIKCIDIFVEAYDDLGAAVSKKIFRVCEKICPGEIKKGCLARYILNVLNCGAVKVKLYAAMAELEDGWRITLTENEISPL